MRSLESSRNRVADLLAVNGNDQTYPIQKAGNEITIMPVGVVSKDEAQGSSDFG